jgi:hypothetical protein
VRPVQRVGMRRAPRVVAPGGTIHVVARCNNREFYFTTAEDFNCLLAPTADPQADARDARRTTQRAVGNPFCVATLETLGVPCWPPAGLGRLPAGIARPSPWIPPAPACASPHADRPPKPGQLIMFGEEAK